MTVVGPVHANVKYDVSTVGTYLDGYAQGLQRALGTVDRGSMQGALELLESAALFGRRVYAIGNGGSAAIADHLCCDWTKGTHVPGHRIIDCQSLASNVALFSALANDIGFEHVYSSQLRLLGKPGDILVAISSSGRSQNIINAVDAAGDLGMTTIGLSGFDGGDLRRRATISLHVDVRNYGVVEDAHAAVMHVLAQYVAFRREG